MSDVQDRINSSTRRINTLLGDIEAREAAQRRAERAEREREAADRARADSLKHIRDLRLKYDVYRDFGTLAPPAVEGERPGAYRQRLYEGLRRRLPSDHDLAQVYADDVPADAARQFEKMMFDAARAEAAKPSAANLPPSGELVRRDLVDPMSGQRTIGWHGRESFIKQLGRESARVVRILDPKTQNVLHGLPFSRRG